MANTTITLADGVARCLAQSDVTSLADVRQFVFGHLIGLAKPYLSDYLSDIYHDVMWVNQHVSGDRFEFWYGADENGTHIGTDSILTRFRTHAWHVVCELRPNRWDGQSAYITVSAVVRPDGWRK